MVQETRFKPCCANGPAFRGRLGSYMGPLRRRGWILEGVSGGGGEGAPRVDGPASGPGHERNLDRRAESTEASSWRVNVFVFPVSFN